MRRALVIVVIIVVIVVAGWAYMQYRDQQAAQQAAEQAQSETVDDLENVIWASGKLEPGTLGWIESGGVGRGQSNSCCRRCMG